MAEEDQGDASGYGWYTVRWAEHQLAQPMPHVPAAGGFAVDPERAQGLIDELTRIVVDVRSAVALMSLQVSPPGNDEVSVNLAQNAAVMAQRAKQGVQTWADQIEATRDALRAQLAAYRAVDSETAERLG